MLYFENHTLYEVLVHYKVWLDNDLPVNLTIIWLYETM